MIATTRIVPELQVGSWPGAVVATTLRLVFTADAASSASNDLVTTVAAANDVAGTFPRFAEIPRVVPWWASGRPSALPALGGSVALPCRSPAPALVPSWPPSRRRCV